MRIMAAIFFGMLLAGAARGEDMPDQRPALRIEAGMHTAQIKRIGVDAACSLIVTGSDDKTARLWALPENGRGALPCCAPCACPSVTAMRARCTPWRCRRMAEVGDGGGWSRNDDVYIFEAATGRLVMRLSRLGAVINHLAFSPDGSRLVSVLWAVKACGFGRLEAGGFSPRTRTMAARAAMAQLSIAGTGSTLWPMTVRSAAMTRMGAWKRRPLQKAASSPSALRCTRMA